MGVDDGEIRGCLGVKSGLDRVKQGSEVADPNVRLAPFHLPASQQCPIKPHLKPMMLLDCLLFHFTIICAPLTFDNTPCCLLPWTMRTG